MLRNVSPAGSNRALPASTLEEFVRSLAHRIAGFPARFVLGTVGKGVLKKAFGNTVRAIEARNSDSV
jgi:hypothetical protein